VETWSLSRVMREKRVVQPIEFPCSSGRGRGAKSGGEFMSEVGAKVLYPWNPTRNYELDKCRSTYERGGIRFVR